VGADPSGGLLDEKNVTVPNTCQEQTAEEGIEGERRGGNASNPSKDTGLLPAAIDDVVADRFLLHGALPS